MRRKPTLAEAAQRARKEAARRNAERLAAVDWAAVREAYELSGETVDSIQARFGLTRHELRSRRIRDAWTTRPPIAEPLPFPAPKPKGPDSLDYRLNRLLTSGILLLEKRVGEEGMTEANARALTELVRAQEIRMRSRRNEKAVKAGEKKSKDAGYDFRDDPEWLDAELDRRIERLARAGGGTREEEGAGEPGGEARAAGGLAELGES